MSRKSRSLVAVALMSTALVALPAAIYVQSGPSSVQAATLAPAGALPSSFRDLVARDKPAVVTVMVKAPAELGDGAPMQVPDFGPDSPFKDFFDRFFQGQPGMPGGPGRPGHGEMMQGLGSGFIIDASGVIVTNNHVVQNASEIRVTLDDGTELPATLVGSDEKTDVAVIRVKADHPLPTVAWGDSEQSAVGDWVVAIGNPFGLGGTVTAGIISARGRDLHSGPYDDFIQVDASINKGNSGGPLFNGNGEVIGVNSAIYSPNGGSVGLGFAIPSNLARTIVDKLEAGGHIERGYLGVSIQPVTPDIAEGLGLSDAKGALVAEVVPGSPAEKAGVRTGDVITGFADHAISDARELSRVVADAKPGESRALRLWHAGKSEEIKVALGSMPGDVASAAGTGTTQEEKASMVLGLGLSDLTPQARAQLRLPDDETGALVTSVDPDKAAASAGINEGDVIVGIGPNPVTSARDAATQIEAAIKTGNKTVLMLVERDGHKTYVPVDAKLS